MQRRGNRITERRTYLPFGKLLAGAFWVAWITVAFSGYCVVIPLNDVYDTSAVMLIGATFGMGFMLILGACFPNSASSIITSFPKMLASSIMCMACTYIVGFDALIPVPVFLTAAFVAGASIGTLIMRCAVMFADEEVRASSLTACICGLVGILFYSLFSLIAQYHSPMLVLVLTGFLPVMGAIVSFMDPGNGEADLIHDEASEKLAPSFWRVVAFMVVIAFPLSMIRGFYPRFITMDQFAISRCDAALMLLILFMMVTTVECMPKSSLLFGSLFYWMFMISVAIMVPVVILGSTSIISGSLATVSKGLLFLAAWSFLSLWSYKTGMSAIRVFGFGFGSTMTATFAGYAVGDIAAKTITLSYGTILESFILLICALVATLLLRIKDLQDILTPTMEMMQSAEPGNSIGVARETRTNDDENAMLDDSPKELPSEGSPTESLPYVRRTEKPGKFMLKCNLIAEENGLTPREADVFILLAKHMEVKSIADELCVSFNTARTHVRHIYAKLDVHNRRELDDLIDSYTL